MRRVSFVLGASAGAVLAPQLVRAEPVKIGSDKPHVHGANGVTSIPEHRRVKWEQEVLDGPRFRLSDYLGKAVFVNVFATWCEPCQHEQPDVVAFARAHAADTAVIGFDLDEPDNDVRAYRKKFAIPYPIAMYRSSVTVPGVFAGGIAYPTTLVFRPDGTLSCAWRGTVSRERLEEERTYALADAAEPHKES